MKRSAFERARDQGVADSESAKPKIRTDYSCKAHGCPNTGTMDGDLCYFHWREGDSTKWHAITQEIRENFDRMRNWGEFSPERKAQHRAESLRRFGATNHAPAGVKVIA